MEVSIPTKSKEKSGSENNLQLRSMTNDIDGQAVFFDIRK